MSDKKTQRARQASGKERDRPSKPNGRREESRRPSVQHVAVLGYN
jgi:hypothetical protein